MAETCTPVQNYPDACASSSSSSSSTKGLPPSPLKHIACGWELWSWSVVPITSYPMWTYLSKLWPKPLGCSHIPSCAALVLAPESAMGDKQLDVCTWHRPLSFVRLFDQHTITGYSFWGGLQLFLILGAKGGCRPIFSDDAYQAVEDENLKGKYQRFNRGGSKKLTLIIATD
ncbi:unnamed protein product [Fusarium graminearum]|uniref:Uncharacterized protein n=1 Tax=Gibberella zeae TaxID=5518 RepID=A0A9N8NFG0_GIBZA|nr:unnamed protein product [Fusarium graminearum]CAG1972177.1 unnamed protein product [Fusarium graminearum]